jgi:type II secretory pathway component PulL
MKKVFIPFLLLSILVACKNNNTQGSDLKTQADALEKEVMDGHNIAMPRSEKIPNIEKQVNRLIDSLDKLPAKAKEAVASYKAKLESLSTDLSYAYMAMDKWMVEFKYDSARNNLEQRIKYLASEKLKVGKVKGAVLGSLAKADSILKSKF